MSSVDARTFKGCTNLNNFTVDSGNAYYSAVNGYLLNKDKTSLVVFPPAKAHENMTLLPPSITSIGDYAFYECTNLTNVTIPQKVTKIGQRAFGLCDKLNHVTFLCESMISPGNIPYTDNNTVAFDNGTNRSDKYNAFSHITISVRKNLLSTYQNNSYYTQFKGGDSGIDPSLSVAAVGDYAFQGAPSSVNEVVLRNDVDYIGAMAFVTSTSTSGSTVKPLGSTIKDVVFCGTPSFQLSSQAFELDDDYHEFYTGQKIYVRKSQVDAFKEVLPEYAQSMVGYQIPGATIANKYGTFSREFDTDLNAYYTDNSSGKLAAFVGMITDILDGGGDYGTATYHIRMNSVDEYTGKTDDYGYVPANTGMLIKAMDDDATATPSGFWYAIGETAQGTYDDATASAISGKNVMQPVTVSASGNIYDTSKGSQYVMQRGVFRKVNQSYSMPIHKAYLQVSGTNGAKVSLVFDEDSEATGISAVNADPVTDGSANIPVYNLQGQRVSSPQHGIYIRGGKKIIVK